MVRRHGALLEAAAALCSSGAQQGIQGLLQLQDGATAPLHVTGILRFICYCNNNVRYAEGYQMQPCHPAGALLLLLMVPFCFR